MLPGNNTNCILRDSISCFNSFKTHVANHVRSFLQQYYARNAVEETHDIQMKSKLILKDFLLVPYFVSHLLCRWNEMGMYDIPAELEYIFKVTGRQKLLYIGHSMGKYIYRDVLPLCKGQ